jgi:hypothetical protein
MGRAGGAVGAGILLAAILALASWMVVSGCGKGAAPAVQDDTYERLRKLYSLYRAYVEKNQKGPPSEEALREFGQKLSPQERADRSIGDDLETIFVSPRDKEKFVVRYNLRMDPAKNQALAWEATGRNGMRCLVLTMGYPAEYDEKTLNEMKK